jgi:hypothetical protein
MRMSTDAKRVTIGRATLAGQVYDIDVSRVENRTALMAWIRRGNAVVANVLGFVRGGPHLVFDEGQPRPWAEDRDAEVLDQVLSYWRAAELPIVGEQS